MCTQSTVPGGYTFNVEQFEFDGLKRRVMDSKEKVKRSRKMG